MTAPNPYTPTPEQQQANDAAVRVGVALISRPLSWQEQREADQLTARALGWLKYQQKLERGRP